MPRFHKKPVVIDAELIEANHWFFSDASDWPDWIQKAIEEGRIYKERDGIIIKTLEGDMFGRSGVDWLIRGVKGELYAIKPDIFEATYEQENPWRC